MLVGGVAEGRQPLPEAYLGLPDDEIRLINYLFTSILDGRNACLARGIEEALGRPPRDFAAYADSAATAGAWS